MRAYLLTAVVAVHAGLLLVLAAGPGHPSKPHQPLIVHTKRLLPREEGRPPPQIVQAQPKPSPPSAPSVPIVKKTTAKTKAKNPPAKAKAAPQKSKQLEKIKQQIASLGRFQAPASEVEESAPSALTSLRKGDYSRELAKCLQEALKLPEYGSVRVEVGILQDGSVASVKVIEAHSEENKSYVLTTLPILKLPPLSTKHETFTLTLENS